MKYDTLSIVKLNVKKSYFLSGTNLIATKVYRFKESNCQ